MIFLNTVELSAPGIFPKCFAALLDIPRLTSLCKHSCAIKKRKKEKKKKRRRIPVQSRHVFGFTLQISLNASQLKHSAAEI